MENFEKEIIEEREGNIATGVEAESTQDEIDINIENPWDPRLIRVDPKTFSLRNILDMINDGDLELAPDFQRRNVWSHGQKARLIESILLRIPLPAFYFSANEEGALQVIDGFQRLSAIYDFVKGGKNGDKYYSLKELEYLQNDIGGKSFEHLEGTLWARRIYTTQIIANVVDPQTPENVKFDIFKRINTGGSPLNAQEIRHCMSKERSRKFLKELASSDIFNVVTNYNLKDHVRMVDREVVLRFSAFRLLENIEDYGKFGTMDAFLTTTTHKIDYEIDDKVIENLKRDFENSMTNAHNLFGGHAFRKWPLGYERIAPINRALFDVWGVILANYAWFQLEKYKDKIIEKARQLMFIDMDFIESISASTSGYGRVQTRFSKVKQLFSEVGL